MNHKNDEHPFGLFIDDDSIDRDLNSGQNYWQNPDFIHENTDNHGIGIDDFCMPVKSVSATYGQYGKEQQ